VGLFSAIVFADFVSMLGRTLFSGRPDGIGITAAGYND
jgi:hypothetical protein